jgi:hypothetical protein
MSYDKDVELAKIAWLQSIDGKLERIATALEVKAEAQVEQFEEKPTTPNNASWKEDPATDKQKAFLVSHSIPFNEPISKGAANGKISRYIEAQRKGA